jgi:hypothetical protein
MHEWLHAFYINGISLSFELENMHYNSELITSALQYNYSVLKSFAFWFMMLFASCWFPPWLTLQLGRAIAQAVSRWIPTAAASVRARVWSSRICDGQSGAGAGFLRVLRFPLSIFIQPNSPSSQSPGAGTIGHSVADVPSEPNMNSTSHYANTLQLGRWRWNIPPKPWLSLKGV